MIIRLFCNGSVPIWISTREWYVSLTGKRVNIWVQHEYMDENEIVYCLIQLQLIPWPSGMFFPSGNTCAQAPLICCDSECIHFRIVWIRNLFLVSNVYSMLLEEHCKSGVDGDALEAGSERKGSVGKSELEGWSWQSLQTLCFFSMQSCVYSGWLGQMKSDYRLKLFGWEDIAVCLSFKDSCWNSRSSSFAGRCRQKW